MSQPQGKKPRSKSRVGERLSNFLGHTPPALPADPNAEGRRGMDLIRPGGPILSPEDQRETAKYPLKPGRPTGSPAVGATVVAGPPSADLSRGRSPARGLPRDAVRTMGGSPSGSSNASRNRAPSVISNASGGTFGPRSSSASGNRPPSRNSNASGGTFGPSRGPSSRSSSGSGRSNAASDGHGDLRQKTRS